MESDVEVLDMAVERIKLRQMLIDWEGSRSIELANKICEMLSKNVALLS